MPGELAVGVTVAEKFDDGSVKLNVLDPAKTVNGSEVSL
jgi:hypothetical protein